MLRLRAISFAVITLLMTAFAFAALNLPALTGRVVDQAGLMTPDQVTILTNRLAAIETKSGHQVAVATVKSLDGTDINDYKNQLFRKWQLGQKDKNDGVLLLIAPNERKVGIEVGYGLEGDLTDATSSVIISRALVPKFKTGDYFSGIYNATDDIAKVITGDGAQIIAAGKLKAKPQQQQATLLDALPFIIFFIIAIIILSNASRGGVVFLPMGGGGFGGGYRGGGGGFDGGGGGFSGGGGDSGGGGASGSW